jgi:hypothetical protein
MKTIPFEERIKRLEDGCIMDNACLHMKLERLANMKLYRYFASEPIEGNHFYSLSGLTEFSTYQDAAEYLYSLKDDVAHVLEYKDAMMLFTLPIANLLRDIKTAEGKKNK